MHSHARGRRIMQVKKVSFYVANKKPSKEQCFSLLWRYTKDIVLISCLLLYTLLGAVVFKLLEHKSGIDSSNILYPWFLQRLNASELFCQNWNNTLGLNWTELENVTEINVTDFYKLCSGAVLELLDLYDNSTGHIPEEVPEWTIGESAMFAGSLITTIGYGHIAPVTVEGRLFCMMYAMIGIPLMVVILARLGDLLSRFFVHCNLAVRHWTLGYTKVLDAELLQIAAEEHDFPLSLAFGITVAWIFLCSAVFVFWENWNYFTAIYFTFITLTTIGLGDVAPSSSWAMLAGCGMVVVGLSLITMCVSLLERKMQHLFDQLLIQIANAQAHDLHSPTHAPEDSQDHGPSSALASVAVDDMIKREGGSQLMSMVMGDKRKQLLAIEWKRRVNQKDSTSQHILQFRVATTQCNIDKEEEEEAAKNAPVIKELLKSASLPLMEVISPRHKAKPKSQNDEMKQLFHDLEGILSDCREIVTTSATSSPIAYRRQVQRKSPTLLRLQANSDTTLKV